MTKPSSFVPSSETETKFEVPAASWAELLDAMSGAPARELHAIYFDTPEGALSRAGLSVRLRRENHQWVQTLKAPSTSALDRLEDKVQVRAPADAPTPTLDLDRHVFGQVRKALRAALGLDEADPLA